jgi:hypothetical protein
MRQLFMIEVKHGNVRVDEIGWLLNFDRRGFSD